MTIETDHSFPPGATLEEELEARGMTFRQLAAQLGRTPRFVGELIRGKRPLTAEVALELERTLPGGPSARFWLNLEVGHRLRVAQQRRANRQTA